MLKKSCHLRSAILDFLTVKNIRKPTKVIQNQSKLIIKSNSNTCKSHKFNNNYMYMKVVNDNKKIPNLEKRSCQNTVAWKHKVLSAMTCCMKQQLLLPDKF